MMRVCDGDVEYQNSVDLAINCTNFKINRNATNLYKIICK